MLHKDENNHERFMELSKHGGGGQRSFVFQRVETAMNGAIASLR